MTRIRGRFSALLAGVLSLALLGLVGAGTSTAGTSAYLCTGYSGCASAGYSHAGYAQKSRTMYWRMYAGHNCTNYVAYRLVQSGMSPERPWSGSGNASNWGHAMRSITDKTPAVGAIAWWDANKPGAGSSGHVAYIEQVISSTEIIVSEDSWGGDFDWRRIDKSDGRWPTGFIHFNDQQIENRKIPQVKGDPQVGQPLTATYGRWKKASTYAVQWLAAGTPIAGAKGTSYTPTAEVRGKQIAVRVTASGTGRQPGMASSLPTDEVRPGAIDVAAPPVVTGTAEVDDRLTASAGSFAPAPARTNIKWRVDGKVVKGVKGATLDVAKSMVGKNITAQTVARRPGYVKTTARSAPVGPVLAGTIEVAKPFRIEGTPRVGQSLSIIAGTWTPPDADVTYVWLRNGAPIAGVTGRTYTPSASDAGSAISARITLSKRNYLDQVGVLRFDGVVTAPSSLTLRAVGKSGRAVVKVRVKAPGMSDRGGRVDVVVGGQSASGTVKPNGRARVVVGGLKKGQRAVTVTYGGTSSIEAASGRTTVQVR